MSVVMYHHPNCGTSRETLALLEERGINPDLVLYMDSPLTETVLKDILQRIGIPAQKLIRSKDAQAMGLDIAHLSEDELIDLMLKHRRLIQRPIILANDKAAIGRPPEQVFDIL